ncbi:NAD(P)-dependent oxidoreductase [Aurantiacibacter xanthus]|jgi:3-hydroxyisobutyrate dehydrogenase-like beta-hydroxyacid dehydrogenase|uniref:NAD(P)-dependent oxidoreductase n=1 Tax=Aurantiacibacter xanthus TaxID=1784712 RepID=A0A3A1P492_9SPHN|nr:MULTISPECIES: NAD(P)-dependent oxidoreductase [Sphingomonadales]RIV83760.1 NAD(P)-dependent oxidoreductase [Aurantiacibacter xanthus]|tara:strand:- start:15622 stop:16503 length:882 start_codon:yes stop_codon:yes gene_type:complete
MDQHGVTVIGFGEAGRSFAKAGLWFASARVFDVATDDPVHANDKRVDYAVAGIRGCNTLAEAVAGARLVLSLVTADQALAAARAVAPLIESGAIFCDMNSVAPATKRSAAEAVEGAGGRYVDVAIMSPVEPGRLGAPLLLSGAAADQAATALAGLGFTNIRVVGEEIGQASAIKMIRSVMVKGIEALTAECVLAAEEAGVTAEVLGSLGPDWETKADYNLDRMMIHGLRRAAEMEEVAATLDALGTGSGMTQAAIALHRRIGLLDIVMPPEGLTAKIDRIASEMDKDGKANAA